jgi:hypothetical protein
MCTLVFAVPSLDLLVGVLLHFALKDSGACGLVEAGCFQDVCCVDVVIMATAHHMLLPVDTELEFPNGDIAVGGSVDAVNRSFFRHLGQQCQALC